MAAKRAFPDAKFDNVFGQARKSAKMFRAELYARVSTTHQQTLPTQSRALREYAARRGTLLRARRARNPSRYSSLLSMLRLGSQRERRLLAFVTACLFMSTLTAGPQQRPKSAGHGASPQGAVD